MNGFLEGLSDAGNALKHIIFGYTPAEEKKITEGIEKAREEKSSSTTVKNPALSGGGSSIAGGNDIFGYAILGIALILLLKD